MSETKKQLLIRKIAEQEVSLARLRGIRAKLPWDDKSGALLLADIAIKQLKGMIAQDLVKVKS